MRPNLAENMVAIAAKIKAMQQSAAEIASFMSAYVARVNEATVRVRISGVRIGSARYSRLAQINLDNRIITFSRFAVQNVPERGLRYLVLHELSHVLEGGHNQRFWQIVARYEPDYKRVDREIVAAFKHNVRQAELLEGLQLAVDGDCFGNDIKRGGYSLDIPDEDSGAWLDIDHGVICGGSW